MAKTAKKVLVIEDDERVARVYDIKLSREGIEVIRAADGEEGLQKIISEKPKVVLLDLMLPKKDGFQVLEEARKIPEFKEMCILILSNLGQPQDKERAMKLGACEYMIKADMPIQQVVDTVKKYLAQ